MIIHFQEVAIKATRKWTDDDGKKRQKTRKFSQTLNPYNRNIDGSVKTRDEILKELLCQRDEWMREVKP